MAPLLSPQELYDLTGLKQSAAQARALIRMGIAHKVRPSDGRIVTTFAAVEASMRTAISSAAAPVNGPRWSCTT